MRHVYRTPWRVAGRRHVYRRPFTRLHRRVLAWIVLLAACRRVEEGQG